jgi:hypothetical protein
MEQGAAATVASVASKASNVVKNTLSIPTSALTSVLTSGHGKEPTTPKTPADEGIDFFENAVSDKAKPISVYEIRLEPDGGPTKELAVSDLSLSLSLSPSISFRKPYCRDPFFFISCTSRSGTDTTNSIFASLLLRHPMLSVLASTPELRRPRTASSRPTSL